MPAWDETESRCSCMRVCLGRGSADLLLLAVSQNVLVGSDSDAGRARVWRGSVPQAQAGEDGSAVWVSTLQVLQPGLGCPLTWPESLLLPAHSPLPGLYHQLCQEVPSSVLVMAARPSLKPDGEGHPSTQQQARGVYLASLGRDVSLRSCHAEGTGQMKTRETDHTAQQAGEGKAWTLQLAVRWKKMPEV